MSAAPRRRPLARAALLGVTVLVFAAAFWRVAARTEPGGFAVPAAVPAPAAAARYATGPVSHGATPFAHSATAVEVPGRGLMAFWYGGSREGARDSAIYSAVYDAASGRWGAEGVVVTRTALESALKRSIRKIGNPVAWRDRDERLWLFFVSASLGGWSGAALNVMRSTDGGRSWDAPRRLVTSPFLNVSTLVKGTAFEYADGSIGLPVYHEAFGKFGELLRLDRDARVLVKQRLAWGRYSLQPVIAPRTPRAAVGFMRYAGAPPGRILLVRSDDGGRRWSEPVKSALPNPNAAVDALRLADGGLLLAFNNQDDNRDTLALAHSADDGRSWRVVHTVEDARGRPGERTAEFSYPWLLAAADGSFHLLYTVDKQGIRHVTFTRAWLAERLR